MLSSLDFSASVSARLRALAAEFQPAREITSPATRAARARPAGDQSPVAPGETLELVAEARRAGADRFVVQEAPQVGGQFRCRAVAPLFFLLQALADDGFQVGGKGLTGSAEGVRVLVLDDLRRFADAFPGQRLGQPAGEQLVAQHTEGIDVGAHIQFRVPSAHLFGAHVGQGPDDLPDVGLHGGGLHVGIGDPGYAESRTFGWPSLRTRMLAGLRSR